MRSLWLASAALCLTAGVAMSQTAMAQTATSPAPTGAPNGAMASPAPGAAPGNMAPANGMSGSGSSMSSAPSVSSGGMGTDHMSSGGMATNSPPQPTTATGGMTPGSSSTAATSPHYTGQNDVSPPAGEANAGGASNGMSSSTDGKTAASNMAGSGMTHEAVSSSRGAGLPANADPSAYLRIASKAIKQHNKMLADDALSHAETRLLTRAVPASSGATTDDAPGVTAIEHARQALASGDYQTAASDTRMAMHGDHGMSGGEGMNGSGMSGGSDMTPMSGGSGAGAMGGPAQ